MNILVSGANGQLGNEMRLVAAHSADNYIFTDIDNLDITNRELVLNFVSQHSVDCVINCAAYTNVDKAEDEPELCEMLNAYAVENLALAVKSRNGLLVHVSTDYVFGGDSCNTPLDEDCAPNPTGVYGLSKLHGEQAIANVGCHHIVFRTAWLYSEFGRNFLKTMLELTATRPAVNVVFDQVGSPTYARDLASAIFAVVENRLFVGNDGIYHFSNEGVCSWFDFAKQIADIAGHSHCQVSPCHSSEFPSKVVRPSFSVLDKSKFKRVFKLNVPYWLDSLKTCYANILHN